MSGIVHHCSREVFWHGDELTTRCIRPAGHKGPHRDGLYWFDDDGLRIPQDQPARRAA